MQDDTEDKRLSLVSDNKSPQPKDPEISRHLPRLVSMQLYELMGQVVQKEVNPKTVSAACQCASAIHKFLKLNHELRKKTA